LEVLLTAAPGTPDGRGLVPSALTEARTLVEHARRAAETPADLPVMQASARGVDEAFDAAATTERSGQGHALIRALDRIVREVEAMAAAKGRRDVAVALPRALAAARQARDVGGKIAAVADQIALAKTPAEAAPLAKALATLAGQLVAGPTGRPGKELGGLLGVQAHLAPMFAGRTRALPSALREGRQR
jgi:hypothetical protein